MIWIISFIYTLATVFFFNNYPIVGTAMLSVAVGGFCVLWEIVNEES